MLNHNEIDISPGDETDQPTCKKNINKAEGGLEHSLNMTKINISLKLFKALLVNRLQVQGEANMTQHQIGGHCNPPFPDKSRASSVPSPFYKKNSRRRLL